MKANLPLNEILRIKTLHDLAILDTPREQSFDDVAQIAMHLCGVPIAVVSLVDKERQWFKSCLGLDATETPRDVAFCAHAILKPDDVLIVEDATKDPRFFDNALVVGAPNIRFYAGAPLVTQEGMALGTLCVIDYCPRTLSSAQVASLKALARQVIHLLELKATNDAIRQYSTRVQLIADKVPVLIGELNNDLGYTFANQKHKDWLGIDAEGLLGRWPAEVFPSEEMEKLNSALKKAFAGEQTGLEMHLHSGRILDLNYLPQFEGKKVVGLFEVATDVTERKVHLQIMQQERERLASIIEGTNIGTWEWNIKSNLVNLNDRWAEMIGYSVAELQPVTSETWSQLLHPDDKAAAIESLERHLSGRTPYHDCQFRMLKKNGDWLWVQAHGKVVGRDENNEPLMVSGMHTDISEIKNTYHRLQEREDLLRSMLSNFPGAAYRCELTDKWRMRYLSDAVAELTGYPSKTFLERDDFDFSSIMHPDDRISIKEVTRKALRERKPFEIEYRIKREDGHWHYVQEIGRGVYDVNGRLEFVDGFIWDIQAKVDSEKEKNTTANKLSQLFKMAPIGIMQVDESGRILEANPELTKILGYSSAEFSTKTFLDLTPEEDWERSRAAAESLKSVGRFGPLEKHYRHKNGDLIAVEISGSLINHPLGENQCWWTLVKDIREQKRVEQMKSEFISTVSHELRTPLTSISGALGLITNSMLGVLPGKVQGMLDIAYKNSQRLGLLINDLLDMEKLLAGKMSFDSKVQPVAPLVELSILENKSYADKYGVKYHLDNRAPGAYVKIDAFRFQQVMNNFLSNAAKFSPAESLVYITLEYINDYLRVSVHDAGSGIPEEFRTRIFQKFSQADSSNTREKGGTGLGLAISKELVERMEGKIGFTSEPGRGTCFYAEFKCASSE